MKFKLISYQFHVKFIWTFHELNEKYVQLNFIQTLFELHVNFI